MTTFKTHSRYKYPENFGADGIKHKDMKEKIKRYYSLL